MLGANAFTVCLAVALGLFVYQPWGRIGILRATAGPLLWAGVLVWSPASTLIGRGLLAIGPSGPPRVCRILSPNV